MFHVMDNCQKKRYREICHFINTKICICKFKKIKNLEMGVGIISVDIIYERRLSVYIIYKRRGERY